VVNPNGAKCIGLLIKTLIRFGGPTDGTTGEEKITAKSFWTRFESVCPGPNSFSFSLNIGNMRVS